jgi:hypothetical protein
MKISIVILSLVFAATGMDAQCDCTSIPYKPGCIKSCGYGLIKSLSAIKLSDTLSISMELSEKIKDVFENKSKKVYTYDDLKAALPKTDFEELTKKITQLDDKN